MPYVKTGDVAARLGVSEQAVRLWCRTGVLPARRPPGTRQWLIDEDEFHQWIATEAVTETVDALNAPYRERRSDEELAAEFHESRDTRDVESAPTPPGQGRAAG